MFTGLITDIGTVDRVTTSDAGREFRIRSSYEGLADGESIAVSGVCLTVREHGDGWFTVAAVVTTLGRTTIGDWKEGRRVNLERALAAGDRLGGHFVLGHVDACAQVERVERQGDALLVDLALPGELLPLIVPHGSIAVDGVSLTTNRISGAEFSINIIPHTIEMTTFKHLAAGSRVNLEIDLIARYVERMLNPA